MREHEWALVAAIRERNTFKVHVARIGALVAHAHEEAIQEYKANFNDTNNYLDLIRDATEEYKESLNKVNPDFDADYYDKLILEADEPQTPAPKDPIGFDQLDPIETPGITAGPSTDKGAAPAEKPTEPSANQDAALADQLAGLFADQDATHETSQPTNPAVA